MEGRAARLGIYSNDGELGICGGGDIMEDGGKLGICSSNDGMEAGGEEKMGFEKWEGSLGRQMGKNPLPVTNYWTQNFNFVAKHSVAGLSE